MLRFDDLEEVMVRHDDGLDRYANVGDKGKAEWDERTDQWSIVWQSNGAWGFYSEEDLAKLCVIDEGQLLTPNNCGCSALACSIINETFLELDGFAAQREQMKGSSYTAEQFAGELARIVEDSNLTKDLASRFLVTQVPKQLTLVVV